MGWDGTAIGQAWLLATKLRTAARNIKASLGEVPKGVEMCGVAWVGLQDIFAADIRYVGIGGAVSSEQPGGQAMPRGARDTCAQLKRPSDEEVMGVFVLGLSLECAPVGSPT